MVNNIQLFSIAGGTGLVLQPNSSRVNMIISARTVISGTQGFLCTFTGGAAITVAYAMGPLELNLASHGRIVQEGVTISALVGNIDGSFVETLMPREYLAAGLEEFRSQYFPRL
jgi:hypothetical protein